MTQGSFLPPEKTAPIEWSPSRDSAQSRLQKFLPRAGKAYAKERNFDLGVDKRENVSALSPWIRHRVLLEEDVLRAALAKHSFSAAEKFIQEVCWRGYFKGWLEHRPEVWQRYKQNLILNLDRLEKDASLARRYDEAVNGKTGIACFDAWTRELVDTGYLHNHTRMWFASIWTFTLKLPWELGADFFYRNLLDGDPASNTCSWRWVCGLHTAGKTYLAQTWNIEKFTDGRFNPVGQLADQVITFAEPELKAPVGPTFNAPDIAGQSFGLLMTEEDASPDKLSLPHAPTALMALAGETKRSVLPMSAPVKAFAPELVREAAHHAENHFMQTCAVYSDDDWAAALSNWAGIHALDCIVTPRLPIGPVRKRLGKASASLNIPLIEIPRPYDQAIWPHTKRGFFGLKKKLPKVFEALDLA